MSIDFGIANEHEYLRQRAAIIAQQLGEDQQFISVGNGKVDLKEDECESDHHRRLRRDLRLLLHLRLRVKEGQVLKAARDWHQSLGSRLREHRRQHAREQDAYDAWWQLPPYQRTQIPQPAKPPEFWITDREGERWLINDRFMRALEDIIQNLTKWTESK